MHGDPISFSFRSEVEELFTAFDVIEAFVSAVSEVIELVGGEEARYEGEGVVRGLPLSHCAGVSMLSG